MTDQPAEGAQASAELLPPKTLHPALQGCLTAGLIVAVPCYLFSFIGLFEPESQGAEGSIIAGFAVLAEIPLWMSVALFVLVSSDRIRLSAGMIAAEFALLVAAALASAAALGLMWTQPDWRVAVPVLLPPLAVAFGFWLRRADRLTAGQRRRGVMSFAAATLALAAPIAWSWQRQQADLAAQGRQHTAEEDRRAAAFEAMWRAPNRGFAQLAPWLDDECPCDEHGFNGMTSRAARSAEAIRRLPSRQADAVRLLEGNFPLASLSSLHQLNLVATPELCRAYSRALDRKAVELDPVGPHVDRVAEELRFQLDNIYWFAANRCDLSAPTQRIARLSRVPGPVRDSGLADLIASAIRSGAAAPPCTPTPDNICPRPGN